MSVITKLLLVLLCAPAWAYIPEYSLIVNKAASQHGKGIYQIEQEVLFQKDAESYVIKETWLVQNESSMRVSFEGRGLLRGMVQGTQIYDSNQKFFTENSVRAARLGEDWLNPLLVFRNPKYLRNRLVSLKIAPPESLNDRAPLPSEGDIKYNAPGFLRLERVGGAVVYAIGAPPQSGRTGVAWIQQDQFLLRKLKTQSQVIFKADDYFKAGDGFWYPKQQTYQWNGYTVTVQALGVKPIIKGPKVDALFRTASLDPAKDAIKLPDVPALKEFYSRFR